MFFAFLKNKTPQAKRLFFQNIFLGLGLGLNLLFFFILSQFFPKELSWTIHYGYLFILGLFFLVFLWAILGFLKNKNFTLPFLKSLFESL